MTSRIPLHPQLQADLIPLGRFRVCSVHLMNRNTVPWFVLVPDSGEYKECSDLPEETESRMWSEVRQLSLALQKYAVPTPDKINIAALGNVVPQLHIHVIARYQHDPAWPAPVWGNLPAERMDMAGVNRWQRWVREFLPKLDFENQ